MKNLSKAFFITDSQSFDPLPIISTLPANIGIIIRDYEHPHRAQYAKTIRALTKNTVLVAKDVALAEKIKADGVHLPQFMVNELADVKAAHPEWVVTAAAHDMESTVQAERSGAHIVFLSPIFLTSSHPEQQPLKTAEILEITKKYTNVYALGGINSYNLAMLAELGFAGFSAISAFNNCGFVATLKAQT